MSMTQIRLTYLSARLCSAAYPFNTWRIGNMLGSVGYIHGKERGADAYVGETADFNFVVFRGTEFTRNINWKDIRTDLQFAMRPVEGNPYHLHRGFFAAWQEIAPQLYKAVNTLHYQQAQDDGISKPWVFTGHSMGGAIAQIAAASFKPAQCITFGSPRVGGSEFADAVADACWHQRWVNKSDVVPRLPPLLFGYMHGGDLHYINSNGGLWRAPTALQRFEDTARRYCKRWEDHAVEAYVDAIEVLLD